MAEASAVEYPRTKFRYTVSIEGVTVAGFNEVSGFDATIEPIEYREGNMPAETPMKVAGIRKYGNITLKKGVITAHLLYDWLAVGLTGAVQRKTVAISLLDEAHAEVATWQVISAWPTKYTAPDFNATSNEIAIESLELAHEGMTRTK